MSFVSQSLKILRKEGITSLTIKMINLVTNVATDKLNHLGYSRTCPVCGWSGQKFLPGGSPLRDKKECPNCGAAERHRLLYYFLTHQYEIGDNVLYFAPMDSIQNRLSSQSDVVTIDINMGTVDVKGDITRLPISSSSFDTVICSHVLEHIPDDQVAMAELQRVLKPGGEALNLVPKNKGVEATYEDAEVSTPEQREEEFGSPTHVRFYGEDVASRLSDVGFDVTVETPASQMPMDDVEKFGLQRHGPKYTAHCDRESIKFEDIHICKK